MTPNTNTGYSGHLGSLTPDNGLDDEDALSCLFAAAVGFLVVFVTVSVVRWIRRRRRT